jgi:hypothetical protein
MQRVSKIEPQIVMQRDANVKQSVRSAIAPR